MDVFKRYLTSFFIASAILLVIAYYAERHYEGQIPHNLTREVKDEIVVIIPALQSYEKCFSLQSNKILEYYFEASTQLEFNLHYHLEGNIFYPVSPKSINRIESTFNAESTGYYCLMWGNSKEESVTINLRFEVKNL